MPLSGMANLLSRPLLPYHVLRSCITRLNPHSVEAHTQSRSATSLTLTKQEQLARNFSTTPCNSVHREVTVPRDFPTSGIAINTRVRKLNFPPFVKNLYCGEFNKSVLSFAEVLNYGRHYNLEEKVKDIGNYIDGKREVLAQTDGSGKLPPEVLHAFKQSGMFGLSVPTEYGGADFLSTEIARIFEVTTKLSS